MSRSFDFFILISTKDYYLIIIKFKEEKNKNNNNKNEKKNQGKTFILWVIQRKRKKLDFFLYIFLHFILIISAL